MVVAHHVGDDLSVRDDEVIESLEFDSTPGGGDSDKSADVPPGQVPVDEDVVAGLGDRDGLEGEIGDGGEDLFAPATRLGREYTG